MPKKISGFTLIEVMVVVTIIAVMFAVTVLIINPIEIYTKTRDVVRITDVTSIALAIEEYRTVNKVYPGEDDVLYTSTDKEKLLAIQASNGWIPYDLSKYISKLPVDPINTNENIYRYKKSGNFYEIDAVIVIDNDKNLNDGGNNSQRFEFGTKLDLLD